MKVVPDSCSLKSTPGDDGSVMVHANFTMRPDPNMDSIIGQTAHNLDEVSIPNPTGSETSIPVTVLRSLQTPLSTSSGILVQFEC